MAALNNATDAETKLRINAQIAILNNNEALAKKYLAEMEAAEAAKKLAAAAADLEKAFKDTIARLAIFDPVASMRPGQGGPFIPETNVPKVPFVGTPFGQAGGNTGPINQSAMDIRLTIDGGSDKLSQAIAESIQLATRSGYNTVPAGFLV
jgi:hypothetical protein